MPSLKLPVADVPRRQMPSNAKARRRPGQTKTVGMSTRIACLARAYYGWPSPLLLLCWRRRCCRDVLV